MRNTGGVSDLCCYVCVTDFEHRSTPYDLTQIRSEADHSTCVIISCLTVAYVTVKS